jgi:hypothetical protein
VNGHGATFTGYVHVGQAKPRFSRYCDRCRARARGSGDGDAPRREELPLSPETVARFLRLAREYRALAARADDPVYARRLARASQDYVSMARRRNG